MEKKLVKNILSGIGKGGRIGYKIANKPAPRMIMPISNPKEIIIFTLAGGVIGGAMGVVKTVFQEKCMAR